MTTEGDAYLEQLYQLGEQVAREARGMCIDGRPLTNREMGALSHYHNFNHRRNAEMKMSEAFPSRYLKAADLGGRDVTVQINYVEIENVSGDMNDPDEKPVCYFVGKHKGFVLNRTNAATISAMHGDETNGWAGKLITIWETETEYRGRMVPCLRVRVAALRQQQPVAPDPIEAPATPEPAPVQAGTPPDDIPF